MSHLVSHLNNKKIMFKKDKLMSTIDQFCNTSNLVFTSST